MAIIAVLPARAGSKRIKNKNIINFYGKPIIYYALQSAMESELFDKIHVSTESEKIKDLVTSFGLEVDFLRPKKLADDYTGTISVLKWVLKKYQTLGQNFDVIFNILPASPLLKPSDLMDAFSLFSKFKKKNPLHVVSKFPVPIDWAYTRSRDGMLKPVKPGAYKKRSQDLKDTYYESGPFSIFNKNHILGEEPVTDEGFISYVMPRNRSIDIDELEDLELAKMLFSAQKKLK